MLRILLASAGLLLGASAAGLAGSGQTGSSVHGFWETPEDSSIVRLFECRDRPGDLCGEIAWLSPDEPQRDVENPDPELRGRPLVGLDILWEFTRTQENVFEGGEVYNPDDGRTYSGEIRKTGPDTLELEGCALMVFCKEQTWERVPADDPRLGEDS